MQQCRNYAANAANTFEEKGNEEVCVGRGAGGRTVPFMRSQEVIPEKMDTVSKLKKRESSGVLKG